MACLVKATVGGARPVLASLKPLQRHVARRTLSVGVSLAYPRGTGAVRPTSELDDGLVDHRWQNYLRRRDADAGAVGGVASLERHSQTVFGSIRLDRANLVRLDGQQDEFEERQVKRAQEEVEEGRPEEAGGLGRQMQMMMADKMAASPAETTQAAVSHHKERQGFFFEESDYLSEYTPPSSEKSQEKSVKASAAKPKQTTATPLGDFQRRIAEKDFSFMPGALAKSPALQDDASKGPVLQTLPPNWDQAVTTGKEYGDDLIEEQYFALAHRISDSVSASTPAGEAESASIHETAAADADPLNEVDRQYFGNARHVDQPVPTDPAETDKMRCLVKESTQDLGHIDAQLFGRDGGAEKKKKKKESNVILNMNASQKEKTLPPRPSSALAFVQRMRKEAASAERAAEPAAASKEEQVAQIGVGLQKRLVGTGLVDVDVRDAVISAHEQKIEPKQLPPEAVPLTRLRQKFKPLDFSTLTSLEVEEMLKARILFDGHDIFAINKPYGVPMFSTGSAHTALNNIEKYLGCLSSLAQTEELFPVHRLDATTTGVLIFAKSKDMHKKLVSLFKKRRIDKRYWAICRGEPTPTQGIINVPLSERQVGDVFRMTVQPDLTSLPKEIKHMRHLLKKSAGRSLPAVTEFKTLRTRKSYSLLEVKTHSGYKHQIRAHLGLCLGCPIFGDHKYTSAKKDEYGKPQKLPGDALQKLGLRQSKVRELPIYLHAKHVQIPDIVPGKNVWIDAPLPHFYNTAMRKLGLKPEKFVRV